MFDDHLQTCFAPGACNVVHTTLKDPWMLISPQGSDAESQLAFTDLGSAKWVHLQGSCPAPSMKDPHPVFIFRHPVAELGVKLEDITEKDDPKVLWDAIYSGGNGGPLRLEGKAWPSSGAVPQMLPICAKTPEELSGKSFRLTLQEFSRSNGDHRFHDVVGEYLIRPRPMGDHFVSPSDIDKAALAKLHTGHQEEIAKFLQ
jgi:hypothetical protein